LTRTLTSAVRTAVQQEVVLHTCAVELLFDSGPVRMNGSSASITIDGNEYPGLGVLVGLSAIEESYELQSNGMSVSLAGIPRDAIALALTETYQNRPATVWEVLLNRTTGQVLADPLLVFRGRMNQMNVQDGDTATVEVTLEDYITDLDLPNLSRNTDEDQQRAYPGDAFFDRVPATVQKEIVWPAKSFR